MSEQPEFVPPNIEPRVPASPQSVETTAQRDARNAVADRLERGLRNYQDEVGKLQGRVRGNSPVSHPVGAGLGWVVCSGTHGAAMNGNIHPLRPFSHLMLKAQLEASLEPDGPNAVEILRLTARTLERQAAMLLRQADQLERDTATLPQTQTFGG